MTAYGYIRKSYTDDRRPERFDADRAAVVAAQAAYLARGYSAGEIVTDSRIQLKRPVAVRPGGFRVSRLARRGDLIIVPTAARLARSLVELHDTLKQWHGAGVVGVILDLGLDFGTPEGRAAVAMMEAGATLDRRLNQIDRMNDLHPENKPPANRYGLIVKRGQGWLLPAEFDLIARVAGWKLGGVGERTIAKHLTATGEVLPKRWRPTNRSKFHENHRWQRTQVAKMHRSYHLLADLIDKGKVRVPRGYTPPVATPSQLP